MIGIDDILLILAGIGLISTVWWIYKIYAWVRYKINTWWRT